MAAASLVRGSDGRVDGRFAGDGEGRGGNALGGKQVEQPVGVTSCATGDDQCVPAQLACCRAGFAQRAGAENDAGGGGEFEAHRIERRAAQILMGAARLLKRRNRSIFAG